MYDAVSLAADSNLELVCAEDDPICLACEPNKEEEDAAQWKERRCRETRSLAAERIAGVKPI